MFSHNRVNVLSSSPGGGTRGEVCLSICILFKLQLVHLNCTSILKSRNVHYKCKAWGLVSAFVYPCSPMNTFLTNSLSQMDNMKQWCNSSLSNIFRLYCTRQLVVFVVWEEFLLVVFLIILFLLC